MNWTGGRLSRHSAASKSVNLKQKQHFAKTKQSLRSRNDQNSPAKWSILNHVVEENSGKIWKRPSSDDPDNDHDNALYRVGSLPKRAETELALQWISQMSGSGAYRCEQTRKAREQPANGQHQKRTRSPRPSLGKRKLSTEHGAESTKSEVDIALDRRQNLLQRASWIETNSLVPVKLSFKSCSRDENIGKRRRVSQSQRPQFNAGQKLIDSPFAAQQRQRHEAPHQTKLYTSNDIKISIGGQAIPVDVSSSVDSHRVSLPNSRLHATGPAGRESSIMLLDDLSPHIAVTQSRNQTARDPTEIPELSPSMKAASWLHNPGGQLLHSTGLHQFSTSPYHSAGSYPYNGSVSEGEASLLPESSLSPLRRLQRRAENGEVIHSSSTAELQHPVPRTFKRYSCWRASPLQSAASNVACIGENEPIVPQEQILDDAIWRTWLASPDVVRSRRVSDRSGSSEACSPPFISPGISVVRSSAPLHTETGKNTCTTSSLELDEARLSGFQMSDQIQVQHQELQPSSDSTSNQSWSQVALDGNDNMQVLATKDNKRNHAGKNEEPQHKRPTRQSAPRSRQADRDELWKKFVNGSDDADDDYAMYYSNRIILEMVNLPHKDLPSLRPRDLVNAKMHAATPHPKRARVSPDSQDDMPSGTIKYSSTVRIGSVDPPEREESSEVDMVRVVSSELDTMSLRAAPATTRVPSSGVDSEARVSSEAERLTPRQAFYKQKRNTGERTVWFTKPKPFKGLAADDTGTNDNQKYVVDKVPGRRVSESRRSSYVSDEIVESI